MYPRKSHYQPRDEFSDEMLEVVGFSDPEDTAKDVLLDSDIFGGPRTLRSMKSEIKTGFLILLSSICCSPVSIFTMVDMEGRCLGLSCVQRRPTFKNLQASSASNSPFSAVSTSPTSSLRS